MTASSATQRVLIVTATFPPDGGVGSLRTLRLLKHLAAVGSQTEVLTIAPATYRRGTVIDNGRLAAVPSGVVVTHAPALRPIGRAVERLRGKSRSTSAADRKVPAPAAAAPRRSTLSTLKRVLTAVGTLPDAEVSWILPAVWRGLARTRRERPDVIYSSGPPYSAHLAAGIVAAIRRVPWVADFRDPWARAPWRDDRFAFEKRAWAMFERWIVSRADAVLFVTHANRDDFASVYGASIAARFHVVPNGCDVSDFDGLVPRPSSGRFVLLHAGSLYGARDPSPLFRAVADAVTAGEIDPAAFRVRLIGRVGIPGLNLEQVIRDLGIEQVVEFVPHVPRAQVLQEMLDASALLVIQPVTRLSVPGKLYEYLSAGRPVLALAEPSGDTARLLRQTPAGVVAAPEDREGIRRALVELVRGGTRSVPSDPSLYDGALRARELVAILRDVCPAQPSGNAQPAVSVSTKRS